jgi:sugar O-acyltransferase (sialic acid O-acetyltransferase NeuD family)
MEKLILIGAGGHSQSVLEVLLEHGQPYEVVGFIDDQYNEIGSLYGIPGVGALSSASEIFKSGVQNAVIAFGSNGARKELAERFKQFRYPTIISKHAHIGLSVTIGDGTVVMPGACLRIGVKVGQHSIINTNLCIDHECVIGDYVHIAPGCAISGKVTIDDGVFLGTGTCVIDRMNIGQWSTVGAGGVVVKDLPSNVLAVGVPAKIIRNK